MSYADLERERQELGMPAEGPDRPAENGRSLQERAGDDVEPAPAEELFFLDQGRRVTIGKLIAQGTPIEYRVTLNAKSVKGGADMGLLAYKDPEIVLAVSARQGKVTLDPTYTEDGELEKVTLRVNFKPQSVHDAQSIEGRAILGLEEI